MLSVRRQHSHFLLSVFLLFPSCLLLPISSFLSSSSFNPFSPDERVGQLCCVLNDAETAAIIRSHLVRLVRCIWSNPPCHGARIVTTALNNPSLCQEWYEDRRLYHGVTLLSCHCVIILWCIVNASPSSTCYSAKLQLWTGLIHAS